MPFLSMARDQSLNQRHQLAGGLKPPTLALLGDRPRQPAGLRLVSILPEHPSQLGLSPAVHHLGRRQRLPSIHPHVKRTVPLKTETTARVVKLKRAHTQIQQHTIATRRRNPLRQLRKIPAPDLKPPRKSRFVQPPHGCLNRCAISIAARQPPSRTARLQYDECVSSPTDRAVDVPAARPWLERRQHFRHHDRLVG